jgi:DNA-directed RNA polymerase subunit RPC12/RpoP
VFLACPNRCSVNRFELWNASVYVDSLGRYLEHRAEQAPLYRCTACGSPAVDLGSVPEALAQEEEQERPSLQDYACPSCEELFRAPAGQNPIVCPACGETFPVAG